jgi:hypothetical protein
MDNIDDVGKRVGQGVTGLARYVRDNPLATVAAALILGMLMARFAFLGNPKDGRASQFGEQ